MCFISANLKGLVYSDLKLTVVKDIFCRSPQNVVKLTCSFGLIVNVECVHVDKITPYSVIQPITNTNADWR